MPRPSSSRFCLQDGQQSKEPFSICLHRKLYRLLVSTSYDKLYDKLDTQWRWHFIYFWESLMREKDRGVGESRFSCSKKKFISTVKCHGNSNSLIFHTCVYIFTHHLNFRTQTKKLTNKITHRENLNSVW